jgi:hypothetical protein
MSGELAITSENRMQKTVFDALEKEVTGRWKNLRREDPHNFTHHHLLLG